MDLVPDRALPNSVHEFKRVAGNLEYKDLENGNLECNLTSKKIVTGISKKNDGNLEFNLENDNLENIVKNFILYSLITGLTNKRRPIKRRAKNIFQK